jgi:hypothetical protein
MSWLVRHLDWILVGVALILSVAWISNYIIHPISDSPTAAIVDDHYVPSMLRTGDTRETKEDLLGLPLKTPVEHTVHETLQQFLLFSLVPSIEGREARCCGPSRGPARGLPGVLH